MPDAGDQPGWAPDPERPGMLRWWNGLGWSDARKAPDAGTARTMSAATQAVEGSTVTAQDVARTTATKKLTQVVPGYSAQASTGAGTALPAAATAAKAVGALNPFATGAVALGVLGFGIGLWGVLPLIGLVLSVAGIVRARRLANDGSKRTGLSQSLAGLVLSVVGLIRWLPLIAELPQGVENFLNS